MKYLAIEHTTKGVTADDFKPYLEEETRKVWELQQKSILREIYFNDNHNAVIILECNDREEAKTILDSLPLVKNNLISFEIMALFPYSGFSRLFK
jgi:hypothetical protein